MRILFVYNYLPTHLGGVESTIDALATELAGRGHSVSVLGADVAGPAWGTQPTSYQLIKVPAVNFLEERLGVPMPLFSPLGLKALRRAIADSDVVHGHGFLSPATWAALQLARLRGRAGPFRVLTEHVGHVAYASRVLDTAQAAAIATMGRSCARLAELLLVCNTRVAAEMRALSERTPVRWVPNGVDHQRYKPPMAGERETLRSRLGWDARPRVLFVGRLVAKKGVHLAVAAARASKGAFELVVVGPGQMAAPEIEHVRILGALPPAEVASLYRACDAFLLPSYGEGFPLVALEALASGLPVFLGADETYAPYLEGAGSSIRLVPLDAKVIARDVTALLADLPALQSARRDAQAHAGRAFSWHRVADTYEDLIDQIKAERR